MNEKNRPHRNSRVPEAEGVLPVVLGKATRLVDMLTEKEKTYEALLHLGIETDTQDMTGSVLRELPVTVTEEDVKKTVETLLGEQQQIPPMYSALKVDGKKLYELAREGKTVERKPRTVYFREIKEILEMELPSRKDFCTCSKGTYIRTLYRYWTEAGLRRLHGRTAPHKVRSVFTGRQSDSRADPDTEQVER